MFFVCLSDPFAIQEVFLFDHISIWGLYSGVTILHSFMDIAVISAAPRKQEIELEKDFRNHQGIKGGIIGPGEFR